MHTVEEVLGLIKGAVRVLDEESVELGESCGRVLSRGVKMDMDALSFDRAMRDGYAVRAADARAGAVLEIIGMQDAGRESGVIVKMGTCVGINTGAKMPGGADAVVMVEETRPKLEVRSSEVRRDGSLGKAVGDGEVEILKGAVVGMHVQRRGSDARTGAEVLATGTRMTAAGMAVAASAGAGRVRVYRRARVAVLTTGDEVVGVEEMPGETQIRNSNGPMLGALARGMGAEVMELGVARDEVGAIRAAVRRGLEWADVLVVTGGMSMGTKDLVPGVLVGEGVEVLVESVKMKPGKPFLFGRVAGKGLGVRGEGSDQFVAGLPGNPVSGFVCFARFVGPLLRAMMGDGFEVGLERAVSEGELEANVGGREFYQPGVLSVVEGQLRVKGLGWRGSADIYTLAGANGLIVHRAGVGARAKGSVVEVLRVGE